MKLSEILYEKVRGLWEEAAEKPFVIQMANGTLDHGRFRYYMLQDYLYLLDYIDILDNTMKYTEDPELKAFLSRIAEETRNETARVHVPNMKKTGITDEEIEKSKKADVIVEYVGYMKRQLEEEGLIAGLTALLQCSWVYAYIGQRLTEEYPKEIASSPYRSWFKSYTCEDYTETNRRWIEALDHETAQIDEDEVLKLCTIFETCARYENRFWDVLYREANE